MSNDSPVKMLSLQPFYGGSHRQFMEDWISHSRISWTVMSLPDRHWKWRMRHSAVYFANQVNQLCARSSCDAIFCTDMLNVAEFKGLLKPQFLRTPIILYFHENQFVYPSQEHAERDMHFAFTNLTSALAADSVWFNSKYNLTSMLEQIEKWCAIWPDHQPKDSVGLIERKSKVMAPGVRVSDFGGRSIISTSSSIHIVWAARWEYDKNPRALLDVLELIDGQIEFGISVIGQTYDRRPKEFDEIQERFSHRILNWGFVPKRDYIEILKAADIILSTAIHEFFGISIVEAMAAGCTPILPNRLSYPELLAVERFPERRKFLYETIEDAAKKITLLSNSNAHSETQSVQISAEVQSRYDWTNCAQQLDTGIESLLAEHDT